MEKALNFRAFSFLVRKYALGMDQRGAWTLIGSRTKVFL